MKGDFTRFTHRPAKRYTAVLKQQGRVDLDADWNEDVAIRDRLARRLAADVIGATGAPQGAAGFGVTPDGQDLLLGAGRYYVDGILCEPDDDTLYSEQPNLHEPEPLIGEGEDAGGRTDLLYLDVWQRHVTAVEDPGLPDPALGGLDTTTRVQTVWQVRVLKDVGDASCGDVAGFPPAGSGGRLTSDAVAAPEESTPCEIVVAGGYRGVENRLYRVEIHDGGAFGTATWKWSRDNGAVIFAVEEFLAAPAANRVRLRSLGRDAVLTLRQDDWIEILDDASELAFTPGFMARVTAADPVTRLVTLDRDVPAGVYDVARHARMRRWDQVQGVDGDGLLVTGGGPFDFEDGIQVSFSGADFQSGDYWAFAARTAGGTVEELTDAPPQGIEHHYAALALVRWSDAGDGTFTAEVAEDCRACFPPLVGLDRFFYVGGGGQEAAFGDELPCSLEVGLMKGQEAVAGAAVQFTVLGAAGTLISEGEETATVVVRTDAGGVAACRWRLPAEVAEEDAAACLQVEARRLDSQGAALDPPVRFSAGLSLEGAEAGMSVVAVHSADGVDVRNDDPLTVERLARGLVVEFDREVAPEAFASNRRRPAFAVLLELPYPIGGDRQVWNDAFWSGIGFRPLVLDGHVETDGRLVLWKPTELTSRWLQGELFAGLARQEMRVPELLCHLELRGGAIWSADDPPLYLDGDAFGRPGGDGRVDLSLPAGDGRRGGDFAMWFWLQPPPQPGGLVVDAGVLGSVIAGTVRDASGAVLAGVQVQLVNAATGAVVATAVTTAQGSFRFPNVAPGTYRVVATFQGVSGERTVTVGRVFNPADFPNLTLRDVPGVGAVLSSRLEAHGVRHPAEVANLEPAALATILEVSEARANQIRLAAVELLSQ